MGAFFGPIAAVLIAIMIFGDHFEDVLEQLRRIADALEDKNKN